MILSLLQALAFFLLAAGYVIRDYPWKNKSQTRMRAFYSVYALAVLALLASVAAAFSGMGSERSVFATGLMLAGVAACLTTIILSATVWTRKKRAMKSDGQRTV